LWGDLFLEPVNNQRVGKLAGVAANQVVEAIHIFLSSFGTHGGVVDAESPSPLAGAEVTCEFDGYTFPARSFSCGFTTAEAVAGRCLFTTPEGDTAIAEWQCETAATMTSDARCEGRATWIEGTGRFAGIQGTARFHTDLFLHPTEGYARWRGNWGVPRMAALSD